MAARLAGGATRQELSPATRTAPRTRFSTLQSSDATRWRWSDPVPVGLTGSGAIDLIQVQLDSQLLNRYSTQFCLHWHNDRSPTLGVSAETRRVCSASISSSIAPFVDVEVRLSGVTQVDPELVPSIAQRQEGAPTLGDDELVAGRFELEVANAQAVYLHLLAQ